MFLFKQNESHVLNLRTTIEQEKCDKNSWIRLNKTRFVATGGNLKILNEGGQETDAPTKLSNSKSSEKEQKKGKK